MPRKPKIAVDTNGWISVKEQLPEDGKVVIIHVPDAEEEDERTWFGYREEGVWYYAEGADVSDLTGESVSHWQPFPNDPTGIIRRHHRGVCRFCGCTDSDACMYGSGKDRRRCGWANPEQTICDNPECLKQANN